MNSLDTVVLVLFINTMADLAMTLAILTFVIHAFLSDLRTKKRIQEALDECEEMKRQIERVYNSVF